MENKIKAEHWSIFCFKRAALPYSANIEYKLGDEKNRKSHSFATFQEAYKWIENQVVM